jgi:FRG domain
MRTASAKWAALLESVHAHVERLRDSGSEPFFRGHIDARLKLIPTFGWTGYEDVYESIFYADFQAYAASLIPTSDSWDMLALMRQHGLPTRLLDWTQSFAVSLYFAVSGMKNLPGAVWILDPYALNQAAVGDEAIWMPQHDFPHSYFDYFVAEKRHKFPAPVLAIYPPKNTTRMFAQRGVFTIHADLTRPLEEIYPKCLKKIEIEPALLPEATRFLQLAGVNEFALFPDLDGLARWLKQMHPPGKRQTGRRSTDHRRTPHRHGTRKRAA